MVLSGLQDLDVHVVRLSNRVYLQNGLVQILVQILLTIGTNWTRNFGPAQSLVQKSPYLDQEILN